METRLSVSEEKVFKLIPADGRIDTKAIAERFYNGRVPANGRTIITTYVRRLKAKSRLIKTMPRGESTSGSGRKFVEVWLKKPRVKKAAKK